ncbi:hypothetical protein M501DRAFT_1001086 [Patellaria atrata CBS 101060]|uniref:Uncharacterized protein n=1 Tax=Patellaria atrata CBS 101060 TaxID=1346257 RepID=A0A9P4VNG2_9PEZI|nr:hypothetical protein M501DRAFT_1001086 [Patellaria atrata CBS 101060]
MHEHWPLSAHQDSADLLFTMSYAVAIISLQFFYISTGDFPHPVSGFVETGLSFEITTINGLW